MSLLSDWSDHVESSGDLVGLLNLGRGPFGSTPVECLVVVDQPVECSYRLQPFISLPAHFTLILTNGRRGTGNETIWNVPPPLG